MVLVFVLSLVCGIVLSVENRYFIFSVPAIFILVLAFTIFNRFSLRYSYKRRFILKRLLIISCGLVLGTSLIHSVDISAHSSIARYSGQTTILSGKVTSLVKLPDRTEVILARLRCEDGSTKMSGKLNLIVPVDYLHLLDGVSSNDLIRLKSKLSDPQFGNNYNEPNYAFLDLTKGIHATSWADKESEVEVVGKSKNLAEIFLGKIEVKVKELIENAVPQEKRDILFGVLFGQVKALKESTIASFRRTGTSHILSVSGLHISSLVALFSFILSAFSLKKAWRNPIIISAIFIYTSLTSFGVSVTRVFIYLVLNSLLEMLQLRSKRISIFLATMAVHLALFPLHLYSIGFQFSYLCVFVLMFIVPIYTKAIFSKIRVKKPVEAILKAVITSITIQLATLPLVINLNNEIFIASWLLNLIIIPFVALCIPLSMIGILGGLVFPALAKVPLNISSTILLSLENLVSYTSQLNRGFYTVATLSKVFVITYYLLFFALSAMIQNKVLFYKVLSVFRRHTKAISRGALIVIVATFAWVAVRYRALGMDFINVGNGDSILINAPFNKTILIDGGDKNDFKDYGESVVMPFLKSKGIDKIDVLIMTHAHSDHAGGLKFILENMTVENFFISVYEPLNSLAEELLEIAFLKGTKIYKVSSGSSLVMGDFEINFINPEKGKRLAENDTSLAMKVSYKKFSAILTGDIEVKAEDYIIATSSSEFLQTKILKVAHHGSITSSNENFLNAISPEYAVISVGKNNYAHPSQEVLARFSDRDIKIFRTDIEGTITFKYALGKLRAEVKGKAIEKVPLFRALEKEL